MHENREDKKMCDYANKMELFAHSQTLQCR